VGIRAPRACRVLPGEDLTPDLTVEESVRQVSVTR
jgi:hypothetical protein